MTSIVRMSGGLGNQMFQYAFYVALQEENKNPVIDLSWYKYFHCHNDFELNKIFNISIKEATEKECRQLGEDRYDLFHKFILKIIPKKTYHEQKWLDALRFQKELFTYSSSYYAGYFQSEKYFIDISDKIRKIFSFDEKLIPINVKNLAKEIVGNNSVSIHVRRGDYLSFKEYQGICDEEYYKKAIQYFKENMKDPVFYVFSNDIQWCKEKFGYSVEYVEGNVREKSFLDMYLMKKCKHHIIANSSFSWWGAWLGEDELSVVVAPSKWINSNDGKAVDIIPERWVKIGGLY